MDSAIFLMAQKKKKVNLVGSISVVIRNTAKTCIIQFFLLI